MSHVSQLASQRCFESAFGSMVQMKRGAACLGSAGEPAQASNRWGKKKNSKKNNFLCFGHSLMLNMTDANEEPRSSTAVVLISSFAALFSPSVARRRTS